MIYIADLTKNDPKKKMHFYAAYTTIYEAWRDNFNTITTIGLGPSKEEYLKAHRQYVEDNFGKNLDIRNDVDAEITEFPDEMIKDMYNGIYC